ncbi:hypothetical protein SAMN05216258_1233 [Albimonas pacifica]|uniref:Uncharacterized protein n=1 Tax=Albimonas pacifica TaxID=1114924 RepID=A0A1I3Q059_9RHOB|nr:hypothetical protein SAMN05216258_1233 [Albimonas pacifica]
MSSLFSRKNENTVNILACFLKDISVAHVLRDFNHLSNHILAKILIARRQWRIKIAHDLVLNECLLKNFIAIVMYFSSPYLPIVGLYSDKNLPFAIAVPEFLKEIANLSKNRFGLVFRNLLLNFPPRFMHNVFDYWVFIESVIVIFLI